MLLNALILQCDPMKAFGKTPLASNWIKDEIRIKVAKLSVYITQLILTLRDGTRRVDYTLEQ